MHALSSHCAVLPLVAAVFLLGAARIEGTVQGRVRPVPEPVAAAVAQPDPDLALIDSVLAKRAPELGLVLRAQVSRAIAEEARRAGYDPLLILAIIDVESDFDPEAISSRGARGLMQIQPVTLHWFAEKQGLRLTKEEMAADPALCVRLGIRYLRSLQERFGGDLPTALMAYNAGPDRIRQALRERAVEPFRFYPRRVKRDFERFRRGEGLGGDFAYAVRDPEPAAR
ncbi:MAG TPA: lytic transglycosylase domain-containing protein [Myxococcaceae bacterium]|nr:lytic transglycosylase domain-containing protein [Myxococcaceae bacterium]